MAVSNSVYNIYRLAAKSRIENGETLSNVLNSMNKLSKEQKKNLEAELAALGSGE